MSMNSRAKSDAEGHSKDGVVLNVALEESREKK